MTNKQLIEKLKEDMEMRGTEKEKDKDTQYYPKQA